MLTESGNKNLKELVMYQEKQRRTLAMGFELGRAKPDTGQAT